jgi:phosphoribosylglycinamide formyltransferase 2
MAEKVTKALTGTGIWGVEFFLTDKGVYFSELSPRPHDTGMVTLAGTQNLNEFELHARAILGLPIPEIKLERVGASAVILASENGRAPIYSGVEDALKEPQSDIRIFNKPTTRPYRRMAVALAYDKVGADVDTVKEKAIRLSAMVAVEPTEPL